MYARGLSFLMTILALASASPLQPREPVTTVATAMTTVETFAKFKYQHENTTSVCRNMTPYHLDEHNHQILPQISLAPYNVTVSPAQVAPGGTVGVTVAGPVKFLAVYGQGRLTEDDISPVGHFQEIDDTILSNCSCGTNNTALFFSHEPITSVTLNWTAPIEPTSVKFWFTVAPSFETFWVNVTSPTVQVTK